MSTWKPVNCRCPHCGSENTIPVPKGLHVTRLPEQRRAIIEGSFQRYTCTECQVEFLFEGQTIYTDFHRMEYIAVETPPAQDWRADRDRHRSIYDTNVELGPGIAKDLASGLRTRLVYGLAALREKLITWDAGIDDRILELCKAQWLQSNDLQPNACTLRLNTVLPGGHLLMAQLQQPQTPPNSHGGYVLPVKIGNVVFRVQDIERTQARQARLLEATPWLRESWLIDVHDARPQG